MSNTLPPSDAIVDIPGPDLFIEAAWQHAREFIRDKGAVPDVMLLGRYADEELLFVFPSSQDTEDFRRACALECANFGADIAIMASETTYADGENTCDIVAVLWRERNTPIRAQFAPLLRQEGRQTQIGAASSLPGTQENSFLESVFGALH